MFHKSIIICILTEDKKHIIVEVISYQKYFAFNMIS